MKRSFIVIISTFSEPILVRFSIPRKKFNPTIWLRKRLQLEKFRKTNSFLNYRHRYIGMNSIPFCVMPFKELLFFKAVISLFQFHCANNIGQNF